MRTPIIYVGRERPGLDLWWLDATGAPVSFTGTPWVWTVTIEQDGAITPLTSNVTANSNPTGDGDGASDVASISLTWDAGALDHLAVGPAVLRVIAALGTDREGVWPIEVRL